MSRMPQLNAGHARAAQWLEPAGNSVTGGMDPMFKRGHVVLVLLVTSGCSGGTSTVPSPSPSPTPSPTTSPTPVPSPTSMSLAGQVTDGETSAPIPGVTVVFSYPVMYATTDGSGNYSFTGLPSPTRSSAIVWASDRRRGAPANQADTYEPDFRYYRSASQSLHLYRIKRIVAGDSTAVTVTPDDTLCVNNAQDSPGAGRDYVCRSVRVVAPSDGIMTVEALSTHGGAHPPLELETINVSPCCSERMGNPTSIHVTAGTEVVAHVEIVSGSTSQSFTLNTSMARQ